MEMQTLLKDGTISYWLKNTLLELQKRDPVDALRDVELLGKVLKKRLRSLGVPSDVDREVHIITISSRQENGSFSNSFGNVHSDKSTARAELDSIVRRFEQSDLKNWSARKTISSIDTVRVERHEGNDVILETEYTIITRPLLQE